MFVKQKLQMQWKDVIEILMAESITSTSIEHSGLQESLNVAQRDESHLNGASMDQLSNVTVDGLLHSTCRNKSNSKMKIVGVEKKDYTVRYKGPNKSLK